MKSHISSLSGLYESGAYFVAGSCSHTCHASRTFPRSQCKALTPRQLAYGAPPLPQLHHQLPPAPGPLPTLPPRDHAQVLQPAALGPDQRPAAAVIDSQHPVLGPAEEAAGQCTSIAAIRSSALATHNCSAPSAIPRNPNDIGETMQGHGNVCLTASGRQTAMHDTCQRASTLLTSPPSIMEVGPSIMEVGPSKVEAGPKGDEAQHATRVGQTSTALAPNTSLPAPRSTPEDPRVDLASSAGHPTGNRRQVPFNRPSGLIGASRLGWGTKSDQAQSRTIRLAPAAAQQYQQQLEAGIDDLSPAGPISSPASK